MTHNEAGYIAAFDNYYSPNDRQFWDSIIAKKSIERYYILRIYTFAVAIDLFDFYTRVLYFLYTNVDLLL